MVATLLVNIPIANGLLVHGNGVSFQEPRRVNLHPHPSGEPSRGSPNGGLFDQDPHGGPPLDPPIGFYG
jgi:hypothetical protein